MKGQTRLLGNELLSSPLWGDNISIPARWLFICLLLKTDDKGEIVVDEDFRVCAEISGLGIQSSQKALVELEKAKMVTAYDDDTVVVHRVGEYRQRQTESQAKAAERVRRWRHRNATANATQGTRNVTPKTSPPVPPPSTVQASTSSTSSTSRSNVSAKWAEKPDDVTDDVWLEFTTMRRKKKATVTTRVLNGIRKQAKLAGITLQEALETCLDRGWASVKAEWLNKDNRKVYKGDISEAGEIDF